MTSNFTEVKPSVWLSDAKVERKTATEIYENDMNKNFYRNHYIHDKTESTIRIISYNVQYWTDTHGDINHKEVSKIVQLFKPDIFAMQEVLIPIGKSTDAYLSDGRKIKDALYKFSSLGFSVDTKVSFTGGICGKHTGFGNALFTHKRIMAERVSMSTVECKSTVTNVIHLPSHKRFIISVVHLDVHDSSGKKRRAQLKSVIDALERSFADLPKMIVGDFNCVSRRDYTSEEWEWVNANTRDGTPEDFQTIQMAEEMGYRDVFADRQLTYTVWSGRRVDFAMVKDFNFEIKNLNVFYTPLSDHIPIIVDILVD